VGDGSCMSMRPCLQSDVEKKHEPCNTESSMPNRNATYDWIKPLMCNPEATGSFKLPKKATLLPCRSCQRGQYLDLRTKECNQYCPEGTYSLVEKYLHKGGNWN
jgi:hypothetical protein